MEAGEVQEGQVVKDTLEFLRGQQGDSAFRPRGKDVGQTGVPAAAGVEWDEGAALLPSFDHDIIFLQSKKKYVLQGKIKFSPLPALPETRAVTTCSSHRRDQNPEGEAYPFDVEPSPANPPSGSSSFWPKTVSEASATGRNRSTFQTAQWAQKSQIDLLFQGDRSEPFCRSQQDKEDFSNRREPQPDPKWRWIELIKNLIGSASERIESNLNYDCDFTPSLLFHNPSSRQD